MVELDFCQVGSVALELSNKDPSAPLLDTTIQPLRILTVQFLGSLSALVGVFPDGGSWVLDLQLSVDGSPCDEFDGFEYCVATLWRWNHGSGDGWDVVKYEMVKEIQGQLLFPLPQRLPTLSA